MKGTADRPLRFPVGAIGPNGLDVDVEARGEHLAHAPHSPEQQRTEPHEGAAEQRLVLGVGDVTIAPDAPVRVKLRCSLVNDGVLVEGELAADWCGPCSRCALDVDGTVTVSVRERFAAPQSDAPEGHLTDDGDYLLEPQHLNLTAMVRDALLLELPTTGAKCPFGDDCEHLPDELKHSPQPSGDDGATQRDERWAALDVLRNQ